MVDLTGCYSNFSLLNELEESLGHLAGQSMI